jgi:aldehyde:ferredoxin oxidoreductase
VGVYEPSSIIYLTDICDKLGFDSSTVGCKVALAIECYEKGLLTKENTDGLELRWGDAKLVETLYRKAANKEGWLGKVLALPPLQCAEMIGGDAPNYLVHIKGSGMNLHDWRAMWGALFGQVVGGGSGWPASGADFVAEPDLGYPKAQDPLEWKDKPEAARKIGMKKYFEDSSGTCWFNTWGVPRTINYEPEALSGATGWDFTSEEMLLAGERLMNLERAFNVRRGLTPADDYDISPRLLEPPPSGLAKGKSIKPHLKAMVMEYYRLMGWDEKTGKPLRSTLKRVGLEDVIQDIW